MVKHNALQSLINEIQTRGWQGAGQAVLDVIEPIAPIVAQLLLVFQPISGIFGGDKLISELVEALDRPDGVAHLREQLNENVTNPPE